MAKPITCAYQVVFDLQPELSPEKDGHKSR